MATVDGEVCLQLPASYPATLSAYYETCLACLTLPCLLTAHVSATLVTCPTCANFLTNSNWLQLLRETR